MTRLQLAHRLAAFLVYSALLGYASRVVYLIVERIWVALRRWYELRQIWNVFESDMDSGFIAEHNARQRLGPVFDKSELIDATLAEMFPKRSAFVEPDPDYRAFQCDAEEFELERSA